jgi:hypothetical protein
MSGLREFLSGMLRANAGSGSPTSGAVGFRFWRNSDISIHALKMGNPS